MPGSENGPGLSSSRLTRHQSRWLSSLIRLIPLYMGWAFLAPIVAGLLLLVQTWWLAQVLGLTIGGGLPLAAASSMIYSIVLLIVLRAVIVWSGERAASRGAEKIKTRLRLALFEQMLARGPQWTRQGISGELASTVIEQVEILDGFFIRYVPSAIAALFLPLAFGIVLLPVDWIAALILLLTAPLIPVFMALVGWGAEAASRKHQLALARLSGFFADRLRGAFTLKLFGRAQAEIETVRLASESLSRKTMAVLRIAFLSSAVLEFFAALGVAAVALYVGLSYLGYLDLRSSALTLPLGLFCLLLAPEVYNPLRQFAANYHDRAAARAAVGHIAAAFDVLPEVSLGDKRELLFPGAAPNSCAPDAAPFVDRETAQAVSVRCVTIRASGRTTILNEASFALGKGEKVALMGASGAGKTSLLEVLANLREIGSGEIRLFGRPLHQWPNVELRRRAVLIAQRPFFLPGSIADNLRLARTDASEQALFQALESACAKEFVMALPQGLQTVLGAQGYGLSGGQLHRLALARLFLTSPDLILLDEPTAHLDAASRDRLMDSLLEFAADRTLLVATHDPCVADRLGRILRIHEHQVSA
ncbi:thiol reductant ABC exporter subunit CydD [Paralcaligenes sp. KSB-10]|uniref:thiol reductant ABC exporter subunit CydD n=1 Tax=Paralcaligenes sp. KSB-10 TaxID=2901142 RepID=UPI001E47DDC0|nr:thiol reductant ABC exporter subunit CydD [Paralcaligenes sp. KSB-10]UHL62856.1 thiol reductant ABC exporter subunit CydD [Paralcaligenes sp. KSB-10]